MKLKVALKGTHPLIMCNERATNKFDVLVKELDKIHAKTAKSKTEEDLYDIADLQFQIHMYYDDKIGPYLPGNNLMASIKDGAKKRRNGPKVETGVIVLTDMIPVMYKGPRDIDTLLDSNEFRYTTSCRLKSTGNRVMVTRPIFRQWFLEAEIELDTDVLNLDDFKQSIITAGQLCGIGTYRPRHGRYEVAIKS